MARKTQKEHVVYLEITSWIGLSIGAVHFYGKLWFSNGYIEVERKMTSEEAVELNKDCRRKYGFGCGYRAGDDTNKFWTEEELIAFAVKEYKTLVPDATILILGSNALADPQTVLDGPEYYKSFVNELVSEAEAIGWYEGDKKKMDKISNRFWKFHTKHSEKAHGS